MVGLSPSRVRIDLGAFSSREDLSKFLVHLTREYEGSSARENLISILREKTIRACNPHCLFMYEFDRLGFSEKLRRRFHTVCFTEAPLPQIKRLIAKVAGRAINLKPYGLVFDRRALLAQGANPAIYINAESTKLKQFLLSEFRKQFGEITTFSGLQDNERAHYEAIVQYYALVNIIRTNHDFTWEREWRLSGDLEFKYREIVAIIAPDPDKFESECKARLSATKFSQVKCLPIISCEWSYEDIVDVMSRRIRSYAIEQKR